MSRTFVTLFKNYIAFFLCLNNKARNKVVVGITKSKCRKSLPIFFKKDSAGRGLVANGLSP